MHTVKKYALYVQLLGFVLFVNSSHENTANNPAFFPCKVNLSDNFVVEWSVDETAKTVEFKVNVTIDERGWVLLGFMPKNNSSDKNHRMKLSDTRGDFLITWPSSSSERTTLDLNTISYPGEIKEDENSTNVDYHVSELIASTNTSRQSVLLISRKLDTGDPQDVPITDKPMWIFGAYGNSDNLEDLSAITSNIDDDLAMKEVIIVQKRNKEEDSIKPWPKVLKEQINKHWLGVVLAVSGVLTVVITATVYCCFRKKRDEFKSKKLKMTFYKEDEDDEARVAFLHSRT